MQHLKKTVLGQVLRRLAISWELSDKQRAWYSSGLVDRVLAAAVLLGGVGVGCRAG